MTEEERAAKRKANDEPFRKHWRVENGELVNDGKGAYATTDREYGDIELLIEYQTVAKADSGIYLRGNPQVQIWDYTKEGGKGDRGAEKGSGGLWNNSAGAPGKDPLVLADKPFGEWNTLPHPPGRRQDDGLPERQARRRSRHDGELLGPEGAALGTRADPAADARRRDPLAQHLRPRDSRRRSHTRS